MSIIAPLKT